MSEQMEEIKELMRELEDRLNHNCNAYDEWEMAEKLLGMLTEYNGGAITDNKEEGHGPVECTLRCSVCDGDGEIEDSGPKVCPVCGGNGYVNHRCEQACPGFPNCDCKCANALNSDL